jgi:hypothetical protein
MTDLESIIRPFVSPDVAPSPFHPAGAVGVPPVRVTIGLKGGGRTFSFSASASISFRMGNKHKEHAPTSEALQNALAGASE